MKPLACISLLVLLVGACADEPGGPSAPCDPTQPECAEEDYDGDGVLNGVDQFPMDELCSIRDDANCGACGHACGSRERCDEQGVCQCREPFGGEACAGCADPHFSAPDCTTCESSWVGPLCDHCANPHFEGPQCTVSLPEFSGADCDTCTNPHFAAPDCSSCTDRFEGPGCDECANPLYTGVECDECANPLYTGAQCDECAEQLSTLHCPSCDAIFCDDCR